MFAKIPKFAVVAVLVFGLALALPCADVFAAGPGGFGGRGAGGPGAPGHNPGGGPGGSHDNGRGGDHRVERPANGGNHGGGGRGNNNDESAWIGIAVAGALLGALLVAAAQPQYQKVYFPGNPVPYYFRNGSYYQKDMCGHYYPVQIVQYMQPMACR